MRSFMDLQIFGPREHFAAIRERTLERLLAGMHSDMIHQFVLGLKRSAVTRTLLPKAGVRGALWTADVVHRQMANDVLHRCEHLATGFASTRWLVNPQTGHLHFICSAGNVSKKRSVRRRHVVVVVLEGVLRICFGSRIRINAVVRLVVMMVHQRIVQVVRNIGEEDLASATRTRAHRAELVVVPSFQQFTRIAGWMSIEMAHRMAVRIRRAVRVVVAVMKMVLS